MLWTETRSMIGIDLEISVSDILNRHFLCKCYSIIAWEIIGNKHLIAGEGLLIMIPISSLSPVFSPILKSEI